MFARLRRKTRPKTPPTQPKTCPPPKVCSCGVSIPVRVAYATGFQALLRGGITDAWRVSMAIPKVIACMKTLSRRCEQSELHYFIDAGIGRLLINKESFNTVAIVLICTWCISGYTDDDNQGNGPYKCAQQRVIRTLLLINTMSTYQMNYFSAINNSCISSGLTKNRSLRCHRHGRICGLPAGLSMDPHHDRKPKSRHVNRHNRRNEITLSAGWLEADR